MSSLDIRAKIPTPPTETGRAVFGCAMFSSAHVEWGTPPDLYAALDKEFFFDFDPCRHDGVWDGREVSWEDKRVFCNPPYGRGVDKWLAKGPEASLAVYLLPARTDTAWFHDYALKADEIRFIRGRLRFVEGHVLKRDSWSSQDCAPFPSMLVIYRRMSRCEQSSTVETSNQKEKDEPWPDSRITMEGEIL